MLEGKADRIYINKNFENTNMVWTLFEVKNELKGDVIIMVISYILRKF